jgi:hypothetical protein
MYDDIVGFHKCLVKSRYQNKEDKKTLHNKLLIFITQGQLKHINFNRLTVNCILSAAHLAVHFSISLAYLYQQYTVRTSEKGSLNKL